MIKDNETLESIVELEGQGRQMWQELHRYCLLFLKDLVLKQEGSSLEILPFHLPELWDSIFYVTQYHSITSWLRLEVASRDGLAQSAVQSGGK